MTGQPDRARLTPEREAEIREWANHLPRVDAVCSVLAELDAVRGELHSLRWVLGLETHEGQDAQPHEVSHHNLDVMLFHLEEEP